MAGIRVGKTSDGRYVPVGHPEAAYLAYSQYDDVPDEVVKELEGSRSAGKQQSKPQDKQAEKSADKSRRGRAQAKSSDEGTGDEQTSDD